MVVLVLLAVGLRLWRVDGRALWFDEGNSLTYARMPLRDLIPFTLLWEEVNPPAYRLTLGMWTSLVGVTVLTARWLSSWLGVLGVVLTYHVGRRLKLARSAALVAALLVSLMPMQVYYSREAKGYTFVQCFILLTLVLWLDLFPLRFPPPTPGRSARWGAGIALTLAVWLALGAHYMSGLLLAIMNLWTLVWLIAARRRGVEWRTLAVRLVPWLAAQAAAALGWVPWVLLTSSGAALGAQNAAANAGLQPLGVLTYFGAMLGEFAAGPVAPAWAQTALGIALLGLGVLGLWRSGLRVGRAVLLLTWFAGPVALGFLAQQAIPFFYPRFLLYVTPALSLLAALGLDSLATHWRLAQAVGVLALAGVMIAPLYGVYTLPQPTPDLRPLAADLERRIRPTDALIFSYSWQPGVLAAYLPDNQQPTYRASFFEPGAFNRSMQTVLDEHGRVWLLTYEIGAENPINDVGLWLLEHSATPGSVWYDASQLTLFLAPSQALNSDPPTALATFDGGRIALHYAPLPPGANWPADMLLVIALNWEARETIQERYVVFVHVLAGDNPVPVAQQDSQPANNTRPTYSWAVGQPVPDYHAIDLSTVPPAPAYRVVAGLYDSDTLARLPVDGGSDSVLLGVINR